MTIEQAEKIVTRVHVAVYIVAFLSILCMALSGCAAVGTAWATGVGAVAPVAGGMVLSGESCGATACPPSLTPGGVRLGRVTIHLHGKENIV